MHPFRKLLPAVLSLCVAPAALAWGPEGHRVVAELAQRQLTPAAEAQVERLLAPEHTTRLADVANWADELRNDPDRQALWTRTRVLHYADLPGSKCHYEPPRDCPDGKCVVGALQHYVTVLGDRAEPVQARRQALKFVVHFVGDIHQPLHAGYRDDKGGNTFQVQFQGKGSNLHRVWDSGMLATRHLDWMDYANALQADGAVNLPEPRPPLDDPYAQWAEESCEISTHIYPRRHRITNGYVARELPVAELRLREAGARLAELLNRALGAARGQ